MARIITEVLATKAEDQEAIRSLALRWIDLMDRGWEIGTVPEIANFAAPEYLEQQLGKKVPAIEMPQVLEVLLAPEKLSYHQQSDKELFELVIKYPSGIPELELQTYTNKWFWLENSYLEIKRLTLADFRRKADDLLVTDCQRKLTEIDQYLERTKKRKQEVYLKYALGPEIQKLATELAFSIWWQDDRKGLMWRAFFFFFHIIHFTQK